ncbi:hypothetical protein AWB78_06474 [Caballeronia calidae]|uniref:Uncharacterized protein n=1 Tax=Caballeronia calidae TaxID=1777139 RepID=A0A158E7X1_9BURK|nr:hypothetical protein AWB78_06474 [Caballeronia calidae]
MEQIDLYSDVLDWLTTPQDLLATEPLRLHL